MQALRGKRLLGRLVYGWQIGIWLCAGWLGLQPVAAAAPPHVLTRWEMHALPGSAWGSRLHFQGAVPQYRLFRLHHPERVVLDLLYTRKAPALRIPPDFPGSGVRMRIGIQDGHHLRLVWQFSDQTKGAAFPLPSLKTTNHQLWLQATAPGSPATGSASPKNQHPVASPKNPKTATAAPAPPPRFQVVIDAGHGGHDPGAIGPRGLAEKHVNLAIARQLARLVNHQPGMRALLVRDRDQFVPLRTRVAIARKAQADIFISIHADGFTDPKAQGASVFTLSERGASSEFGLWLAQKESRSALIGGVHLGDKDDLLASVLLDLSQSATLDASYELGGAVLRELGGMTVLHKAQVQQAGFAVLKAPDLPSILVETGFISNPQWERRLQSPTYQLQIAQAILRGIQKYYTQRHTPPTGVWYASLPAAVG